ncbi:hypothetical protein Tco_1343623 [Tanacetum coccineum]
MRQPPNTLDMRLDDNPKIRGYNGIFWSFSMDIWHGFMKELHEFLFDSDWDQLSHPPDIVCMECGSDMVPKLRAKGNRMNDEKFGTFEEMDGYASGPDEEDTHNSFSIYRYKIQANIAHFQRSHGKGPKADVTNSYAQNIPNVKTKFRTNCEQNGGTFGFCGDQVDNCYHVKTHLSYIWKYDRSINGRNLIIMHMGKEIGSRSFRKPSHETPGWVPDFTDDLDVEDQEDMESNPEDIDNQVSGNRDNGLNDSGLDNRVETWRRRTSGQKVLMIAVYGPHDCRDKQSLWEFLHHEIRIQFGRSPLAITLERYLSDHRPILLRDGEIYKQIMGLWAKRRCVLSSLDTFGMVLLNSIRILDDGPSGGNECYEIV